MQSEAVHDASDRFAYNRLVRTQAFRPAAKEGEQLSHDDTGNSNPFIATVFQAGEFQRQISRSDILPGKAAANDYFLPPKSLPAHFSQQIYLVRTTQRV
jgi:hypothetical protein